MMSRSVRIITISSLIFVLIANLAFFAFQQNGVWSNNWVTLKVFGKEVGNYEYRGFRYFYQYLSSFPGLTNSISVVNQIARIVSGGVHYTGFVVVDAIIGVLTIIGSTAELLFAFIADIINMFIWLFGFFVPTLYS